MFESGSILAGGWKTSAAGILSALSLISGPILVVLMLCFYWMRRGRPLPPPLFPAIPLALTSVSIQVVAASLLIINAFEAHSPLLLSALKDSQLSLMWRVIGVGACIVVAAVFQITRGAPAREVKSDGMAASLISIGPAAWSAAAALAVGILAWFCGDIVQLVAMVADSARVSEAEARLGNMGVEGVEAFAHLLSTRLILLFVSAVSLTCVLIAVAGQCLKPGRARRLDVVTSGLLAIVLLGWCGASTAGMVREIQYLRTLVGASQKTEKIVR